VAASLSDDTSAGINQDDSQVCCRAAGNHVTSVLLVSRSVGNDKPYGC